MLHVTNGDVVVHHIRAAGLPGQVVPWRDVLHEGPVPSGLSWQELREVRARFIAAQGWGDYATAMRYFEERDAALATSTMQNEVVLWFEHDLYDQLQLIQVLAFCENTKANAENLRAVVVGEYLGQLPPEWFAERFPRRQAITAAELSLAARAWAAFRSPDPTAITTFLESDHRRLPYLGDAFYRHLQEFPDDAGLGRTERQIVEIVSDGGVRLSDAFRANQERESAVFLGDAVFAIVLERLSGTSHPLIRLESGKPIRAPRSLDPDPSFWKQRAVVTDLGRATLEGGHDWIGLAGINRWLGGVHLRGHEVQWRWDEGKRTLVSLTQ